MSTKKAVAFLATAFFCFSPLHAEQPKILAVVVVDQMIPRYLDKLDTFKNKAAVFPEIKLNYVPTQTAPGHAAIVTGAPPSVHGITANEWFDTSKNKKISSVNHPSKGRGPYFLEATTIGDALKKKSPKSQVVSLSMKDRSAVLMGGKSGDAVAWFDWKVRKFVTSSYYKGHRNWLDEANSKLKNAVPSWLKMHEFLRSPACDRALFQVVLSSIDSLELGKDEHPDLLLVSFSGTDNIGHRYGPDSAEMAAQIESLNVILKEFVHKLESTTGDDFLFVLTSDHGVLPVPEEANGQKMNAVRVKKKAFIKKMESALESTIHGGPWIANYATMDLYFDWAKIKEKGHSPAEFLEKAVRQLRTLGEVAQVYTPPHFPESDEFTQKYKRSYFKGRSGDLMVRLKPGVLVSHESNGTNHGSPYDYDAVVPLLVFGKSISAKISPQSMSMEDIFPAIWNWLGLTPTKNSSLTEILSQ